MNDTVTRMIPATAMRGVGTLVDLVAAMPKGDPRYALFLGAGASVSSGIPTAAKLMALWRRVFLDDTGNPSWQYSMSSDFEKWLEKSYPVWQKNWENRYGHASSRSGCRYQSTCINPEYVTRQD